mmetsp:Transcript_118493/g.330584  ORF Transcript_118493/g.330584 Transcript_118493/m.330584 type:complete len:288 (-) Transcript_118493:271-1134(-)
MESQLEKPSTRPKPRPVVVARFSWDWPGIGGRELGCAACGSSNRWLAPTSPKASVTTIPTPAGTALGRLSWRFGPGSQRPPPSRLRITYLYSHMVGCSPSTSQPERHAGKSGPLVVSTARERAGTQAPSSSADPTNTSCSPGCDAEHCTSKRTRRPLCIDSLVEGVPAYVRQILMVFSSIIPGFSATIWMRHSWRARCSFCMPTSSRQRKTLEMRFQLWLAGPCQHMRRRLSKLAAFTTRGGSMQSSSDSPKKDKKRTKPRRMFRWICWSPRKTRCDSLSRVGASQL